MPSFDLGLSQFFSVQSPGKAIRTSMSHETLAKEISFF